jgi:hypothetical protein
MGAKSAEFPVNEPKPKQTNAEKHGGLWLRRGCVNLIDSASECRRERGIIELRPEWLRCEDI